MSKIKLEPLKAKLKNALITGVQSVFSTSHLSLRYGLDVVEAGESAFMKKATGQSKETTVNERRSDTNRTRLEAIRTYNDIADKVKRSLSKDEILMHDVEQYGNV